MKTYHNIIKELFLLNKKKGLLLFSGIVFIIIFCTFFIRFLFLPYNGLVIDNPEIIRKNGHIYYYSRFPYSDTRSPGYLQKNDRILAINNHPVTDVRSYIDIVFGINSYEPVSLSVIRNENEDVILTIVPQFSFLRFDWIFTFLLSCMLTGAGIILLINSKDAKFYPYILFFFLSLLYIGTKPFKYENTAMFSLTLMGSFSFWFLPVAVLSYPRELIGKIIKKMIIVLLSIAGVVLISINIFCFNRWILDNSDVWYDISLILEKIKIAADILIFFFYIFCLCFTLVKERSILIKFQAQWILAGFLISFSPSVFFDQLPLLFEPIAGSVISLGNFTQLFMLIFPFFLLISVSEFLSEKYRIYIPKTLFFLSAVSFLLLFFLILSPVLNLYVTENFGLSNEYAAFFNSFLYICITLPVILFGLKFIENAIYGRKKRRSFSYQLSIETELKQLKEHVAVQDSLNNSFFQEEKMNEVSAIITMLGSRIEKRMNHISRSLMELKKKNEKIITLLGEARYIDDTELEEKKAGISLLMNTIAAENLHIKDFFSEISGKFSFPPSLPSRVNTDYVIKKAVTEIKKMYRNISIKITKSTTGIIECRFSDIVQALKFLFIFIYSRLHQSHDITIHMDSDDKNSYVWIVYQHIGRDDDINTRLFKPYCVDDRIFFDLYICKILIEKNTGTIMAHTGDQTTKFIISFPLQEKG